MSLMFFAIPAATPEFAQNELNAFCAINAVVALEKHLVDCGLESFWSVCVTLRDGPGKLPKAAGMAGQAGSRSAGKIDYREVLSEADFSLYVRLRELRKSLAVQEAVPVYNVMTNEQMAQVASTRPSTDAALGLIEGFGPARIEKFAVAILEAVRAEQAMSPP
jgi:superfamily II DNA helicase RecQ